MGQRYTVQSVVRIFGRSALGWLWFLLLMHSFVLLTCSFYSTVRRLPSIRQQILILICTGFRWPFPLPQVWISNPAWVHSALLASIGQILPLLLIIVWPSLFGVDRLSTPLFLSFFVCDGGFIFSLNISVFVSVSFWSVLCSLYYTQVFTQFVRNNREIKQVYLAYCGLPSHRYEPHCPLRLLGAFPVN